MGLQPSDKHTIMEMFEHFDEDNSGKITLKQFEHFVDNTEMSDAQHGHVKELDYHWGYDTHNGAHTWADHYPDACGKCQSPIDIVMSTVKGFNKDSKRVSVH